METLDTIHIITNIQNELDKYLHSLTNLISVKIYIKILEIYKLFNIIKELLISNNIYSI
jgi:hypothetical protein